MDEGFVKSFDRKATIIEILFFLNIMEKKVLKKILVSFLLNLKHDTLMAKLPLLILETRGIILEKLKL
jgi:hypothetical protein